MDQAQQIDYYKGAIKDLLKRVPASVNSGSYDQAVAFKKLVGLANKAADSARPRLATLTDLHNRLRSYYK